MEKLKTYKEIFKTPENYERYSAALSYEMFSTELNYYDKSRETMINLFDIPAHELSCKMKKRIDERAKTLVHLARVFYAMESEPVYQWCFEVLKFDTFPTWKTLRVDILEKIIKRGS